MEENTRIITDRYRNDIEYSAKTTNARADRTHGHSPTKNQKEKLDGRMIRTTVVSRTVREIPFGTDKIDGSHAQLTR